MRREFGMSAREVFAETPAWEIDVLLEQRDKEIKAREKAERQAERNR